MFIKLRNRFILTIMALTTSVLLISFTSIYLICGAASPRPRMHQAVTSDPSIQLFLETRLAEQITASLAQLLIILIITGVAIELLVLIFSFYFAEQSIKPIKEAYDSQKTFIANAGHELKTPVAAISANLEALESEISPTNWTKNIRTETEKTFDIVKHLLALARAEDSITDEKPEKIKINTLLSKTLSPFSLRAAQKGITLTKNLAEKSPTLELPKLALTSTLEVLLDNATKYAKTKIEITTTENTIIIINDGPTIPANHLAKIFDRFYQVDKSADGSGLGLAIAKATAEKYHWSLTATSNDSLTTFTLKF
jgi:signal transduction histidine kinase